MHNSQSPKHLNTYFFKLTKKEIELTEISTSNKYILKQSTNQHLKLTNFKINLYQNKTD